MHHTHPSISLAKAVSWRLVGTFVTFITAYWFTQDFRLSFSIGLVESISKLAFYYAHERAWIHIIHRFFGQRSHTPQHTP
jgi:uncharacterized membrane protein